MHNLKELKTVYLFIVLSLFIYYSIPLRYFHEDRIKANHSPSNR